MHHLWAIPVHQHLLPHLLAILLHQQGVGVEVKRGQEQDERVQALHLLHQVRVRRALEERVQPQDILGRRPVPVWQLGAKLVED